jgi:hypothetical protein
MSWRQGEIWLDVDLLWFREPQEGAPVFAANAPSFARLSSAALAAAIPDGLSESRRRRAERRRRHDARKTRAAAIVIGPAVVLALAAPRLGSASRGGDVLAQDPPSQTLELRPRTAAPRIAEEEPAFPPIRWNRATSSGLPYAGSLTDGTQLPLEGPDWVTWDPVADRVPNRPHRLFGNEHVIRKVVTVLAAYRAANPEAPRVVVGDISFRGGGPMELHRSHQNGLDVDVYYPRRDDALGAPTRSDQVDRRLTQDLLDRFVAAGVEKVFVGYGMSLHGPADVVTPYPNHADHMHVRFRSPL